MKTLVKGLILGVVSFSIIACSSSTPKCSDSRTKELVINIAKQKLSNIGFGDVIDKLDFKVDNVRTIEYQKSIDRYSCQADLIIKNKENNQSKDFPITYTVQKTDDGKKFYVEVFGL